MSFARERAAKAADLPGLALELRRKRNALAPRFARECLPRWYPTFPSAYYLTDRTEGGAGHLLSAVERASVRDHLDHRSDDSFQFAQDYCAPNYAYREVEHRFWHMVRPWERLPSYQWAVDALARGEKPERVRAALLLACDLEYDWDARQQFGGLSQHLNPGGVSPEARHCLLFYHRGLYNPYYEDYLREPPDPKDPVRR